MSWPTDPTHDFSMEEGLPENHQDLHESLLGHGVDSTLIDPVSDLSSTRDTFSAHTNPIDLGESTSHETFGATQHLLHEFLGMDIDDNAFIDMNDSGGRVRLPNSSFWASDMADHLSAQGLDIQAHENVPSDQLLMDLTQGRQVVLPSSLENVSGNTAMGDLIDDHGGKVAWVTGVDFSDEKNPQILLVDHHSQGGASTPYPLQNFVQNSEDSDLSYVSTSHPPTNIMEIADGFNHEAGVFDQIVDWVKHHAPRLASAFVGAGVGSVVGDFAGSDIASVLSHYTSEKVINSTLGLDDAPTPASNSAKFGVALMDDATRNDFLDKL